MKILKIGRLGIAINSVNEGKNFWFDIIGLKFKETETIVKQKVRMAIFSVDGSEIELKESTKPDGPIAGDF